MKGLRVKVPKQKSIPWLGAIIDSLYTSLPILSILNFLSIQIVLYASIRGYIGHWVPWLTFTWFIIFMVILTLVIMVFVYKFVIPSLWVWRGRQLYGHDSKLMDEVKSQGGGIEGLMGEMKNQRKEVRRLAKDVRELRKIIEGTTTHR